VAERHAFPPHNPTSAKQLVPVPNKPVLFYGIEARAEAGIDEIGIVIAPRRPRDRTASADGARFGLEITSRAGETLSEDSE
jgi:glucose-1-phosphate thymidylyltransferase